MANAEFQRKKINLNLAGFRIANENELPEDKAALLKNIRIPRDGILTSREGLYSYNIAGFLGAVPHYFSRRVKNQSYDKRIHIVGDSLVVENVIAESNNVIDSGFAAGATVVVVRPEEAITPFIYIGNKNKNKKIALDETGYSDIGITAPNVAPTVKIAAPNNKIIDELGSTVASWTGSSGAIVPTAAARVASTVITAILYDSGTSGWASIILATFPAALQEATVLQLNDAGLATSESTSTFRVYPSVIQAATATIKSISYDAGAAGNCTIHLTVSPENLEENSILKLGGTEYVKVKSVLKGIQGEVAIRTSTVATFAAGNAVEGAASFRIYLTNQYTAGVATIATDSLKLAISALGVHNAQRIANLDLSVIGSGANARPVSEEDDYIYFAILLSDTSKLTEGQLMLDLSQTGGDFKDYWYYPFNANALTQSIKNTGSTLSAVQIRIQRDIIRQNRHYGYRPSDAGLTYDDPVMGRVTRDLFTDEDLQSVYGYESSENELALGDSTWTVFKVKLKDFIKVGNDQSRTLKNVTALRLNLNVSGAVDVYFDSLLLEGSYELDSDIKNEDVLFPYYYTYRYRSSTTRAVSSFSPPNRNGMNVSRGRIELSFTASADTQVDKIDVYRFGGKLSEFHYIGTFDNVGTAFYDELPDYKAIQNPIANFNYRKPFVVLDKSRTGDCTVVGTKVTRTGGADTFNTKWAHGNQIIITDTTTKRSYVTRLYGSPSSSSVLEIEDSLGTLSAAEFYIPAAQITGKALHYIFGPFGEGNLGLIIFGFGDANAPGTVYWTDGNSPDTMTDTNYLEITDQSEPLIAGCIWQGTPFLFTNSRIFRLQPRITEQGISFVAIQVATKGIIHADALTVGDNIFLISQDSVNAFNGADLVPISADIDGLIYKNSIDIANNTITLCGETIPKLDFVNSPNSYKLTIHGKLLFLSSTISGSKLYVFDLSPNRGGWISIDTLSFTLTSLDSDSSSEDSGKLILGSSTGLYFQFAQGSSEFTNPLLFTAEPSYESKVIFRSEDFGDNKIVKDVQELALDYRRPTGGAMVVRGWFDGVNTITINITGAVHPNITKDILALTWERTRTLMIDISWTALVGATLTSRPEIYAAEYAFLYKGELIRGRYTDWMNLGIDGDKLIRSILVEAEVFGVNRNLSIEGDAGTVIKVASLAPIGQQQVAFDFPYDTYSRLVRLRSATADDWILYGVTANVEKAPKNDANPSDWDNGGYAGLKFLQRIEVDADTSGNPVTFKIQDGDEVDVVLGLVADHQGRTVKSYDFPAVTGYLFRVIPTSGNWRRWNVKYYFEPMPEQIKVWQTLPTSHGLKGFQHVKEISLLLNSNATTNLTVTIDGVDYPIYQIPSTSGEDMKIRMVLKPIKGKVFTYKLESDTPFRPYRKHFEVLVMEYKSQGPYNLVNPFLVEGAEV